MLLTKSEAKQASKKLLSVLLAVIMIMTSMSVCFGTISFAADDTAAVQAFVAAMKCDAMKNFSTTTGTNDNTNTYTYNAPSYAYYKQVKDVVQKLDAAIKGLDEYTSSASHNDNQNCSDGYNTKANKCTDLGYIEKYLKAAIGDEELATLNSAYNLAALLNAVFNMHGIEARNADGEEEDYTEATEESGVPAQVTNVLVVTTTKVAPELLQYATIAEVPEEIEATTTYTLNQYREDYTTTTTSGCGNNATTTTTHHYHIAMNTGKTGGVPTVTTSNGTTNKAVLTGAENTFNNTYANYINAADVNEVLAISEFNADTLTLAKTAIESAKNSVINTHSEDVYNHFFDEVKIAAAVKNIDDALQFLAFKVIVDELNRLNAINYDSYDEAQLLDHLTTFEAEYKKFTDLEPATQQLVIDTYDFDKDAIEATLADLRHDYELYGIRRLKEQTDEDILKYNNIWNIDDVDEGRVTTDELIIAVATIGTDVALFGNYVLVNVVEVCGENYMTDLNTVYNQLQYLCSASGYNDEFLADYATYRDEIKSAIAVDSETLLESVMNYDSWYTGLRTLINNMKTELTEEDAEKLFDELNEPMVEYIDNAYAVLRTRTETEVNTAYDLLVAYKAAYGTHVSMASIAEYKAFRYAVESVNVTAYEFLVVSPNVTVKQETIDRYNAIQDEFPEYYEFLSSHGFSTYQTSVIGDIVREDTTDDIARENADIDEDGIGEYVTTDAKIENVIKVIDAALSNADVQSAIGVNIGEMLNDLVTNAIISDSFINTVVDMLYPLVLKEFGKVFANDLPKEASGQTVNYKKLLHDTLRDAGFEIYPDLLATELGKVNNKAAYADTITKLNAAYTEYKNAYGVDGYTTELDPDGGVQADGSSPRVVLKETAWDSSAIRDEDGKLTLTWGIDAAKEEGVKGDELKALFYETFDDAVEGLKPLLLAIIANKAWDAPTVEGFADAAYSAVTVTLELSATANSGYANLLVPVYEALGVPYTSVSTVETTYTNATNTNASKDVELIIGAILDPIFTLVDRIGKAPLDTILGILPNLCFALSAEMVTPLLSMLKTKIEYLAPIDAGFLASCVSIENPSGGVDIDVGEMLNINDLIDLSDGLNSILAQFGLDIPYIDQGYVSSLGTLKTIDTQRKEAVYTGLQAGKAYHIDANKADVLLYLVDYLLDALAEPGFLDMIGSLFAGTEEPAEGEDAETPVEPEEPEEPAEDEGEAEETTDILTTILEKIKNDPDAAIAAIVELLNMEGYDTLEAYTWYDGYIDNQEVGTLTGTPAYEIYMNPGNDWTKEKAEYLYENLDAIVGAVLTMAEVDLNKDTEEIETLEDVVSGLLTDETLTSLAALLAKLDLNALLAGDEETEGEDANTPETAAEGEDAEAAEDSSLDVNALVKNLLGIDLAAVADKYADIAAAVEADEDYVYNFGVNDGTTTFATALAEMLEPLSPVFDFLLAGKDLEITLSATQKVKLAGSDGYNSAIVPLLEALGCDVKALGADDNALELVINALVGKVEALTEDGVIKGVIDLLPGVLYFLASNNLATVVRNLLQPVYEVLDIIRPIYDLDLAEMIANIEVGEEGDKKPLGLDLDVLNLNTVFDLVEGLLDVDLGTLFDDLKQPIYDVCKVVGTEYDSVSTFAKNEDNWKKGAYSDDFDQADMLTVILSFVLDWATVPANAVKLDELLGTDGIVASIGTVFESVEITYRTPNWMYWFETEKEFDDYIASGEVLPNTLLALTYPNDWSDAKAQYIADNLADIVDAVVSLIEIDGEKYDSVSALIDSFIGEYISGDSLDELVGLIAGLLEDIDDNLLEAAGRLLDVDIVGLKSYEAPEGIDTTAEFAAELADVLTTYADGLMNWLFFGDDYVFAKKSDETDTITINGGLGYEKGLALILEALGVDAPAADEATVENVLAALAARVDEILADPVNEVIDLLPNLIYFLNADGASVAVDNLLQPVYALVDKVNALGILEEPISIADLIKFKTTDEDGNEKEVKLNLALLSLQNIVDLVEELTGLDLTVVEDLLVDFCLGKIEKGEYTFKMTADRKDTITVLLTTALLLVSDEDFAAKLDELLGTEVISAIKTVFAGGVIEYTTPDWNYALADNGTVDAMKYSITYPTNWTEDTAKYVSDNLAAIVDDVISNVEINGEKYDSLAALLEANVNVFTSETLESLIGLITDLLGDIDDTLLDVGMILDVDLVGLKNHKVPADITTVDAFAEELADILSTYAPGVIEWLLLGRDFEFFVDGTKMAEDVVYDKENAIITITGAQGYAEGLALLLEALGCENLPEVYNEDGTVKELVTADVVAAVLKSLATRIDEILADPINEVIDLLPNLLYFLNTNGVAAVIDNTIAALMVIVDKLGAFGVELDINELVNLKKLMKIEDTDATISIDNLSMKDILQAVSYMAGIDLTLVEDVLVGFALGQVNEYDSVSANVGTPKKMTYKDEFDKHDMITVLANIVLLTIADEKNAEFVEDLVGEDIYDVVVEIFDISKVPVQDFDWALTDKADTDEVFSALQTSELFDHFAYGPLYTKEMEQYISDNFDEFIDNLIYLLGIEINGETVETLTDLLNGLVGGSVYNSTNVIAIRDAIAGLADSLETSLPAGDHILEILKSAKIADLKAVADVEVPEFSDDRDAFEAALCDVLEPLYPVLGWLLADEDITFFVDEEQKTLVTLPGAEGYAYGLIPVLEVFDCDDILTPDEYYTAIENGDADTVITALLDPILNRVDEILADPAEEILAILPNIIYFINSNGVDTVVKNTLNAVYTLLTAIEPIAKVDLYELIGLDLETLTFEKLFDMALDMIRESTGYDLTAFDANAIVELTTGTLESYTSKNGKTAYRMIYQDAEAKGEMITVALRLVILFIAEEDNLDAIMGILKDNFNMGADAETYVRGVLEAIIACQTQTQLGMDQALAAIYYIFYASNIGVGETAGGLKDVNEQWIALLVSLGMSDDPNEASLGNLIRDILGSDIFDDVIDTEEGLSPNGLIAFFQKIISWFRAIIEWFKNLFA